jgi:gp16 family phage-associated protein
MTPTQVKTKFKAEGKTFTAWAKEYGYNRHTVYLVLNGQLKATFGKSHEIAVALGLKPDPAKTRT